MGNRKDRGDKGLAGVNAGKAPPLPPGNESRQYMSDKIVIVSSLAILPSQASHQPPRGTEPLRNPSRSPENPRHAAPFRAERRLTYGLMTLVFAFGVLLAAGTQREFGSRTGWVPALIILSCTLGFLGLWSLVLFYRRPDRDLAKLAPDETIRQAEGGHRSWSRTGWASVLLTGSACLTAIVRQVTPGELTGSGPGGLILLVLLISGLGVVTALVAVSDPGPRRGRWLGLVAFAIAIANIALVVSLATRLS